MLTYRIAQQAGDVARLAEMLHRRRWEFLHRRQDSERIQNIEQCFRLISDRQQLFSLKKRETGRVVTADEELGITDQAEQIAEFLLVLQTAIKLQSPLEQCQRSRPIRFSPALGMLARELFDRDWVDAQPRAGKRLSGITHSTVPSIHPYIQFSYFSHIQDVLTLAHELGHGLHFRLAGAKGLFAQQIPPVLGEIAAFFDEMLVFRRLLSIETDPERRRRLLALKIEASLHNTLRQAAVAAFELRMHDERRSGEVSAPRIGEIWLETQAQSMGGVVRLGPDYGSWWLAVAHVIRTPFYVYAYALAECLAAALFQAYEERPGGFARDYGALLAAGSALRLDQLRPLIGRDPRDPDFWRQGLAVTGRLIDALG